MQLPTLSILLLLCASVLAAGPSARAVAKRSGPSARAIEKRSGPSARAVEGRSGPSARALERDHDIGKRDLVLNDDRCPSQHTACGISNSWSHNGWECIDTLRDLESCGGCVTALFGQPATGVDCTTLEGVEDVACVRGLCTVYTCRDGYVVSADGQSCAPAARKGGLHQAASIHF